MNRSHGQDICNVCMCVGSLPDSLTDGVDEMKELEEQEMSILQDVLK